jgi:hypothetical protein
MKYSKKLFGAQLKLVEQNSHYSTYTDDNEMILYDVYNDGTCGIDIRYDVKFYIGDEVVVRDASLYVHKNSERAAREALRRAFAHRVNEV